MKCTRKWTAAMLGLGSGAAILTSLCAFTLSLVCELAAIQTVPWAEACLAGACLAGAIVGTYVISLACIVALSVQETVRWFVTMTGEMRG